MITKTVECDGMQVIIRRRSHMGRVLIVYVRQIFGELYPEFKELFEQMQIRDITDDAAKLSPVDGERFWWMVGFSGMVASIVAAKGLPYRWPAPGEVPSKDWVKEVFAHYMIDGEGGIWEAVSAALRELDKPTGPKETWPKEALETVDLKDPN